MIFTNSETFSIKINKLFINFRLCLKLILLKLLTYIQKQETYKNDFKCNWIFKWVFAI